MWMYDEGTGMILLVIVLVIIVGYLLYQLAVGAGYVLVAVLGVLYTVLALAGSLLLAGLDMLFVPAQLDTLPWTAWMAWGALFGAAAGFWTVAPVYGLRRLRLAVLVSPAIVLVAVFGLRLVFAPATVSALAQPAGGAQQAAAPGRAELLTFTVPVSLGGITHPKEKDKPTVIKVLLGEREHSCAEGTTGPILAGQPPPQPTVQYPYTDEYEAEPQLPLMTPLSLRSYSAEEYYGDIPVLVRIQPTTLGYIGNTVYWTQNSERGGYLIWFLSLDEREVLFTLVVEPDGEHRFVDGALWGTGPMQGGVREYTVTQRSGMLGLGRIRQQLRVEWVQQGFRRDDGRLVGEYGLGFGHCTFPEGQLKVDMTPHYAQDAPANGSAGTAAPGP